MDTGTCPHRVILPPVTIPSLKHRACSVGGVPGKTYNQGQNLDLGAGPGSVSGSL